VPLLYAPAVTTYTAYAIQLLVVALIYAFIVEACINRFAGLLLVAAWGLLVPTYETWASVTNSQWTCSVSLLLILVLPEDAIRAHRIKTAVWTLLCGLNGVPSCMLAPGFLARAYVDRSRPFAILGAILAACSILQFAILMSSAVSGRAFALDLLPLTLPTLVQTILVPLFGVIAVERLIAPIRDGASSAMLVAAVYAAAIALAALAVAMAARASRGVLAALVAGQWLLVSLLNTFGATGSTRHLISGLGGARYYLFGAMCFCLLLAIGTGAPQRIMRWSAAAMLMLIVGASVTERVRSAWVVTFITGPSWRNEVAKCPAQANCVLEIWPGRPLWIVTLGP
jgi:hypothetical protein